MAAPAVIKVIKGKGKQPRKPKIMQNVRVRRTNDGGKGDEEAWKAAYRKEHGADSLANDGKDWSTKHEDLRRWRYLRGDDLLTLVHVLKRSVRSIDTKGWKDASGYAIDVRRLRPLTGETAYGRTGTPFTARDYEMLHYYLQGLRKRVQLEDARERLLAGEALPPYLRAVWNYVKEYPGTPAEFGFQYLANILYRDVGEVTRWVNASFHEMLKQTGRGKVQPRVRVVSKAQHARQVMDAALLMTRQLNEFINYSSRNARRISVAAEVDLFSGETKRLDKQWLTKRIQTLTKETKS